MGKVAFKAVLNYQKLVGPVAEFLEVPAEEAAPQVVNEAQTWIEVFD